MGSVYVATRVPPALNVLLDKTPITLPPGPLITTSPPPIVDWSIAKLSVYVTVTGYDVAPNGGWTIGAEAACGGGLSGGPGCWGGDHPANVEPKTVPVTNADCCTTWRFVIVTFPPPAISSLPSLEM